MNIQKDSGMRNTAKTNAMSLWFSLAAVAFLALWIRVEYFHNTVVDNPIRGDAAQYVQYALNLVNYGVFSKDRATDTPQPDSYWAPGYPAYIAIAMLLEKNHGINAYRTLIYSQAFTGALIAVFTLLTGRLFLHHYWALFAAILVAFSPHLISLGNNVLTETLFTLLLLVSIYSFLLAFLHRQKSLYLLSGSLFGLSYLVNPVAFFTPIFLTALALFLYRSKQNLSIGTSLRLAAPCLLVFFVIVSIWAARGAINVGDDSPTGSSRLLGNIIIGTHHDFHDIWRANPRDPNNPATIDNREIEGSFSAFFDLLLTRIKQDPLHYAKWYFLQKPLMLWDWNILTGQGDIYVYPVEYSLYHISKPARLTYSIMLAAHYWLFSFAVLGLFFAYRQHKDAASSTSAAIPLFLYLTVIYVSSVYVIAQAEARYSIPLRPEMYLCSAYFLSQLFGYIRARSRSIRERTARINNH